MKSMWKSVNYHKKISISCCLFALLLTNQDILAQRKGGLPPHSLVSRVLISDGPQGPIHGGESAVTDLVLLEDDWVYGSTKATWGAEHCHIFRTDGETVEHLRNLTTQLREQSSITDLVDVGGDAFYGCTSTYDEIFDDESSNYPGGHLFYYNPGDDRLEDLGTVVEGQGINCITYDSLHGLLYGVTYPAGHLFSYDLDNKTIKDYGEVMTPWRVSDLGRVSWRGVPKVLMIDDVGTVYYSTYFRTEVEMVEEEQMKGSDNSYSSLEGGRIYRLAHGEERPVFTGAIIPAQTGMDSDPIYENGIASAIPARDGGFWCGTINDGFLFKFIPSTSTIINKGKAFQYWNLRSLAYGGDGKLYMLGGRDEDNSWIMSYDPSIGSLECLGWPENTAQCSIICADKDGKIIIAENLRHSFMWLFDPLRMDQD